MEHPRPHKTTKPEISLAGSQNMTIRVQLEKLRALDDLAQRKGTTRSAIVQLWIADGLEREAAALRRLNDTRPRSLRP